MSDDKKLEEMAGNAMEKFRLSPRKDARAAIEKQLIENKLLKEDRMDGSRFWLFTVIFSLAVLIPAGYFISKYSNNKPINNATLVATDTSTHAKDSPHPKPENPIAANGNKTANRMAEKELPATQNQISNTQTNQNKIIKNEEKNTLVVSREKAIAFPVKEKIKTAKTESVRGEKAEQGGSEKELSKISQTKTAEEINASLNKSVQENESTADAGKSNTAALNTGKSREEINAKVKSNQNSPNETNAERAASDGNNSGQNSVSQPDQNNNTSQEPVVVNESPMAAIMDTSKVDSSKSNSLPDTTSKPKHAALQFSVDISGAAQFSSIEYGSAEASKQSYLEKAKQSEKTIPALTAGIVMGVQLRQIIFQTGIGTSSLKTDFNSTSSQTMIDSSASHYNYTDTGYWALDSLGALVWVVAHTDSTWVYQGDTSVETQQQKSANKISYLEIPFMLGYQFPFGEFDFEIRAGVSLALLRRVNTSIVSFSTGNIEDYKSKTNSPYRNSYWNFIASANVLYNLNKRFSLFLQPSVKYGLNSVFKDDYPVTKKIQGYAIGGGLRIKL